MKTPLASAPLDPPGRWEKAVLALLVLVPAVFTAVAVWPELSVPIPSLNDDAFHYVLIQRASEALASGENPFDHWVPELDLGFPQLLYYQHLPHLTIVALHRLLLKRVDLLTVFNLVRYLLLVGFPLTVYWSMRRLGFSVVAGAVGAAAATLLSSNSRYGFDYDSYVWRAWGLYTQLWAMHLGFIALACLDRLLQSGKGYIAAILACSALALSHLLYSYMMVPAALVLLLVGVSRANLRQRIGRLTMTGAIVAVISAYFWLPFLRFKAYLGTSPYEFAWKYDSFGAGPVFTWLADGDLLDYGRLPVLTLLLALGIVAAVRTRSRPARLAVVLFVVWLALFCGRPAWGPLANLLPMHERLHFHRFIGGVHLAAILLIGLGGEWLWRQLAPLREWSRALAGGLVLMVLLLPALEERRQYYAINTQWMEETSQALARDADARAILATLAGLPPGRVYVGRRDNWGKDVKLGYLPMFALLTFHRVVAISPYESFSLNADLIWHFEEDNPAHYDLFDVRYVVAPRSRAMPGFLRSIEETPRYVLYHAETSGYARFAAVSPVAGVGSQPTLFSWNRKWMASTDPETGRFLRYDYPGGSGESGAAAAGPGSSPGQAGCTGGEIVEKRVLPAQIDLEVTCPETSTVVLKVTYHPNWRITVDGREGRPFMVSPSFIGFAVPAGRHQVSAQYRSTALKSGLLLLGGCTLLAVILFRRRLFRLEAIISSALRPGRRM
jgi:Bacterial membrane protein YfhO/6-pyruvoyl-tetrahydropterin synthase related domain